MTAPATIERKERRTLIEGRMVASHVAPEYHGNPNVYDYHYCRCIPCSEAKSRRRSGTTRTAQEVQAETRAEFEYLVEEYTFMRSYGSGHEWACNRMGVDPSVFQRRLERNNLTHLI